MSDPEAQIRGNIGIYNDALRAGDYDYALEFFGMYLKRNLDGEFRPMLLHELARAYAGKGDSDKSLELLREASELAPDNEEIRASLNHALGQTAEEDVSADALNRKGMACFENRRFDQAVAYYEQALEHEPDNLVILQNMAGSLAEAGHPEQAAEMFKKIIERAPNDSENQRNYGVVLRMVGRLEEAVHAFSEAIGIDPNNGNARMNVARALFEQGKLAEAKEQCEVLTTLGTTRLIGLARKLLKEIEDARQPDTQRLTPFQSPEVIEQESIEFAWIMITDEFGEDEFTLDEFCRLGFTENRAKQSLQTLNERGITKAVGVERFICLKPIDLDE